MTDVTPEQSKEARRLAEAPLRFDAPQRKIDLATLFGLLAALALIGIAIALNGSPLAFIDVPAILRRAGEVSPAMGLIGTLVGLVQMLGSLDSPERIGPAMSIALLTTLYGALMANVVFLPLASKLERNATVEQLANQIYIMAVASMGRQENPRRLEMLLNTMLPAGQQVRFFD